MTGGGQSGSRLMSLSAEEAFGTPVSGRSSHLPSGFARVRRKASDPERLLPFSRKGRRRLVSQTPLSSRAELSSDGRLGCSSHQHISTLASSDDEVGNLGTTRRCDVTGRGRATRSRVYSSELWG
jgi:hypothetical protein